MFETLLNGGPFMMALLIIVGSIIFISVKILKSPIILMVLCYWVSLVLWLVS